MTINTDLLVAAPMLQDYFVDKDTGKPLAGGIVSLYRDTARSFYKNWYYQTGTPGAYTWVALDNPMSLSSVGTIQDPNGNDVIPFFYPYSEDNEQQKDAYYITVYSVDENGQEAHLQFTRENFPFLPSNLNPTASNPVWRNYILNNVYWRNIGSLDAMTVLDQVIAPSQHEGYTNGDIRFIKNVAGGNDDIIFAPMTTTLDNDITPETMLSFACTGVQVGETVKCIQYPISLHVKTLNSVAGTIIFHGQNVAGNTNNYVDLYFYQFLGTGALSQPDPILIQRVVLNNEFGRTLVPFITPSTDGLVLGSGGDDALFLRVQYPLSALCSINHTKPQIYFSTDVPDNDFDTYDQVETIINSPRTGDVRTSISEFYPYGYVAANDGTIGTASSNATNRANIDTWPLYKLLWEKVLSQPTFGPIVCPIYTSAGALSSAGADAITDWNANKQLSLTKLLGQVLAGTVPASAIPTAQTYTADSTTDVLTVTNAVQFGTGTPVVLNNTGGAPPAGLSLSTIYYAIFGTATQIALARSLNDALAGTFINFTDNGTGVNTISVYRDINGQLQGEKSHIQTVPELATHHHTVPFSITPNILSSGGGHNQVDAGPTNTSDTGSSTPFNVMQPTTFLNMYIKL